MSSPRQFQSLFASDELVARIERCERNLMRDCTSSVARNRPSVDTMMRELSGGLATFAGSDSPLNKVAGIGFDGPVDAGELQEIEAEYAGRDAPVHVELSIHADPSIPKLLSSRGYALQGFENVLGMRLSEAFVDEGPSPGIEIFANEVEDLETWLDVVVTGFATPDAQGVPHQDSFPRDVVEDAVRDMVSGSAFLRYLARLDGEPAGGASMRIDDGIAQLCGAATLPAMRRRGVQSALLSHRLRSASESGCDIAVVTTQPGSKSAQNVQRLGFELLYTRAVLVLEPGERT